MAAISLRAGYYDQHRINFTTGFPFGHGLSYTQFDYSALRVARTGVSLTVANSGAVAGAEIVQLYVRDVEASVYRPDRELKGFKKVQLAEGATQEVCFCLGPRAFAFYDTARRDWYTEPGEFEILVGSSSEAIHQTAALHVVGGEMRGDGVGGAGAPLRYVTLDDAALAQLGLGVPPPVPLALVHRNTTFDEISANGPLSWAFVRCLLASAELFARRGAASGLGDGEAVVNVVVEGLKGSSLRTLQLMTGGALSDRGVQMLLHCFNGRPLAALAHGLGGCCGEGRRGQ